MKRSIDEVWKILEKVHAVHVISEANYIHSVSDKCREQPVKCIILNS